MSERNDGGPAFPRYVMGKFGSGEPYVMMHDGMSLRDWFAGMALQGLISRHGGGKPKDMMLLREGVPTDQTVAQALTDAAYQYADEMLAERDKERQP